MQLWDAKAWKEAARLDTPSGLRSTLDYAVPTPDWATLLVHSRTRKLVKEERAGKVHERLQVDGRIDLYDAATGKPRDSIAFADRGPAQLFVVPGGRWAVVNTEGSFAATDKSRPVSVELVDLAGKKVTKLLDTQAFPAFTPDGQTAYLSKMKFHQDGTVTASLAKFDLAAAKEVKAVTPPDNQTYYSGAYLSPDGKWLATVEHKLKPATSALVVFAADTLTEAGRLPAPKEADRNASFDSLAFTADGAALLTRCGGPLLVWDVAARKAVRTVHVGEFQFARMAVSPDGRRVALAGMPKFTTSIFSRNPDPMDLPQPRVQLLDLADTKGEPRVLVLPHGVVGGVAFSPDGGTLAVGTTGGVHLLDVKK